MKQLQQETINEDLLMTLVTNAVSKLGEFI